MVLAGENVAMPSSPRNKRKAEATSIRFGARLSLAVPVRLNIDAGTAGPGTIRNASISGALIATAATPPPLAAVTVRIPAATGAPARDLRLDACVVRTEAGALAVEWRDMACEGLVRLLRDQDANAQLWARDCTFD